MRVLLVGHAQKGADFLRQPVPLQKQERSEKLKKADLKKSVFLYFAVMIKLSLKNYLKCLAHIFVPLGCIFLGVLFGAHALFGALFADEL